MSLRMKIEVKKLVLGIPKLVLGILCVPFVLIALAIPPLVLWVAFSFIVGVADSVYPNHGREVVSFIAVALVSGWIGYMIGAEDGLKHAAEKAVRGNEFKTPSQREQSRTEFQRQAGLEYDKADAKVLSR